MYACFLNIIIWYTRFKALAAVLLNVQVLWVVTQCHWVSGSWHLEGLVDPDNEGTVILWNVGHCAQWNDIMTQKTWCLFYCYCCFYCILMVITHGRVKWWYNSVDSDVKIWLCGKLYKLQRSVEIYSRTVYFLKQNSRCVMCNDIPYTQQIRLNKLIVFFVTFNFIVVWNPLYIAELYT
jgi:hypothetical protein